MGLKERYEQEDFVTVTEEVFHLTSPTKEELVLVYEEYKKACEDNISNGKKDAHRGARLQTIANAFLSPSLNKEYSKEINAFVKFTNENKLSVNDAANFSVRAKDDTTWIISFKGHDLFEIPKINLPAIALKYMGFKANPLLIGFSSKEKEGLLNAYWAYHIIQYKNQVKSHIKD